MKRNINIILLAALLGAGGCSKEAMFESGESGNGYGRVLTSSLSVEVKGGSTRADSDTPDVSDFVVEFCNASDTTDVISRYKYSQMPEIVTLPAGVEYIVKAHYGENLSAAWNSPYYCGESGSFKVEVDKIVDSLDPISCKLSNVKVTINFDESLAAAMSSDSKVDVHVGESGELSFTKSTQDNGYFAYVKDSNTLAATFSGTVNGEKLIESKTYTDVEPGVHYSITFRFHTPNASGSGSASISTEVDGEEESQGFTIQASVTIDDLNGDGIVNFDPETEILLDDDEIIISPSQGEDDGSGDELITDDPTDPDTPSTGDGPTVTPYWPEGATGTLVDLNAVNNADGLVCAFRVDSSVQSGFTQFEVDIVSDTLTPDELGAIGLAQHLDLAETPADLSDGLTGLGFPINVKGMTYADFNITSFMPLLAAVAPSGSVHIFTLTISDENGTTVIELKIKC